LIIWIRGKRDCEKLVSYQRNQISFESIGTNAGPVKISIGKFSRKIQVINKATQIAQSLDDYQYLMCSEIERYAKRDPLRRKLEKYRIANISGLTLLRSILASAETTSTPDLAKKIEEWVATMSNLIKIQMGYLMDVNLDKFVVNKLKDRGIENRVNPATKEAFTKTVHKMIPTDMSFKEVLRYVGITESELDKMLK
jgi:hypothetical protein